MAGADIGAARVDKLAVHLVGEKVQVVLLHHVAYLVHLPTGVQITCGIVGVADEDGPGALVDELLKLFHLGQRKALFDGGGDGADDGSGRNGKRHVIGIGRLGHDNLVTGVQTCQEREEHGLRTAAGDDDVIGGELNAKLIIVAHQFPAVAEIALARAVFQNTAVDIANGIQCLRRRRQVGLSDIEMIHMHTTLLGSISQRSQFADGRLRHFKPSYRYLWHYKYCSLLYDD